MQYVGSVVDSGELGDATWTGTKNVSLLLIRLVYTRRFWLQFGLQNSLTACSRPLRQGWLEALRPVHIKCQTPLTCADLHWRPHSLSWLPRRCHGTEPRWVVVLFTMQDCSHCRCLVQCSGCSMFSRPSSRRIATQAKTPPFPDFTVVFGVLDPATAFL